MLKMVKNGIIFEFWKITATVHEILSAIVDNLLRDRGGQPGWSPRTRDLLRERGGLRSQTLANAERIRERDALLSLTFANAPKGREREEQT